VKASTPSSLKAKPSTTTTPTWNTAVSVVTSDVDNIKRKIENTTQGLSFNCFNFLHNRILPPNQPNALTICDYISSLKSEINPSDRYRKDIIILLCNFSLFLKIKSSRK